ncbi:MAG: hypothetical protein ACPG9K_01055 [Poseidonibacter sp.]
MDNQVKIHPNQQTMFTDELSEHIKPVVEGITFNNAHLVANELIKKDKSIAQSLLFEIEMQLTLGDK